MPIIKSAVKRMHQARKRREQNLVTKKNIKLATKSFTEKPSAEALSKVQSELDKAVKKGLLKKATVARRKAAIAKAAKEQKVKPAVKKVSKTATKPAKAPAAKKTTATATKAKPATKKATTAKAKTTKK